MIIDLDKIENLLIQSNKTTLLKGLDYFSNISDENLNNVFYNLTRSTSLKDIDINFIIAFLYKSKLVEVKEGRINKKNKIDPNNLIEELIFFYYSVLLKNKELNESLFVKSEFKIANDDIIINIFSVQVKHRIFFTILQSLELLEKTETQGLVIVKNYSLAKKFLERPLRKISPKELEEELEQRKIYGIEAEKFVLDYEFKRLNKQKDIDWVAEYIVNEGYDVISYNHESDDFPNRFIEVKSYEGEVPYFFWSRNEYTVAKRKKEEYWLYLVNRLEINKSEYSPIMIQNPYENILDKSEWIKEVDKYKISLNA